MRIIPIASMAKVAKKTSDQEFTYRETRDLWREIISREKDRVNIHFDLENDDSVEEIKTVNLDFKKDEYSYRVKALRCAAGGDWESPIYYFRCQIENKYESEKRSGNFSDKWKCIVIPVNGNIHLTKAKDGGKCAKDAEDYEKLSNSDVKAQWDYLKKEIPKRIKGYFNALDYDKNNLDLFNECGLVDDLMIFWKTK